MNYEDELTKSKCMECKKELDTNDLIWKCMECKKELDTNDLMWISDNNGITWKKVCNKCHDKVKK